MKNVQCTLVVFSVVGISVFFVVVGSNDLSVVTVVCCSVDADSFGFMACTVPAVVTFDTFSVSSQFTKVNSTRK